MASNADKHWHRSDTTLVVAPVAVACCSRSSSSSATGGTTALRGLNPAAPSLEGPFTR